MIVPAAVAILCCALLSCWELAEDGASLAITEYNMKKSTGNKLNSVTRSIRPFEIQLFFFCSL